MIDLTAIRLKVRKQFDDSGACPMWQEIDALCTELEGLRVWIAGEPKAFYERLEIENKSLRDRIFILECQLRGVDEHNRRLERERNAAEDALTASKGQVSELREARVTSEKYHFAREQDLRNAYRLLKIACDAAEDELRANKSQGAL